MKNKIFITIFIVLIPILSYAAEVNLDIANSTTTIIDNNTFRLQKVTGAVDGVIVPDQYWIDFKWDPIGLVFVPINIGKSVPTGQTWVLNFTRLSDSLKYILTLNPIDRAFEVSYQALSETAYICMDEDFIQGDNEFDIYDSEYYVDDYHALITFTSTFDGCGDIYFGQTITAIISHIPSWFDFNQKFGISLHGSLVYCEPDGTVLHCDECKSY